MDRPHQTRPTATVLAFRPRPGPAEPTARNRRLPTARAEIAVFLDHLNRSTRASGHAA